MTATFVGKPLTASLADVSEGGTIMGKVRRTLLIRIECSNIRLRERSRGVFVTPRGVPFGAVASVNVVPLRSKNALRQIVRLLRQRRVVFHLDR